MGCNCKAQKRVSYIQTKYGGSGRPVKKNIEAFNIKYALRISGLALMSILFFPIIVVGLMVWGVCSKRSTFNISKYFNKK